MRKIREILRLKSVLNAGNQKIANSLAISSSTVHECLRRANLANLGWPLPDDLDDEMLEKKLYSPPRRKIPTEERGELDWPKIHEELKRKHMTLMLLWNEYRELHSAGLGYSQFCRIYLLWKKQLETWMHQDHKAGEKMFVDYAGGTIPISDGRGGIHQAQIFVAVLGASGYIYAEATMTQSLPDWIESHCRAFKFFGGVPEISIPDNLRNCTILANRYEPDINPTYHDLANHYGFVVMPARVRKPKDKSLAEKSVQIIQYQILAKLRDQIFFSLVEVNEPIAILLEKINLQAFQKLPGSRLSQFEKLDKPALKPLPSTPYKFAEWAKVRAGCDYHVEVDKHFYSVPYTFIKKTLDVRFTDQIVEVFYRSKRIASHMRKYIQRKHTTLPEHMPKAHQKYAEWTPERIINWARKIGVATAQLVEKVIETKEHPQLAFRA
jgi:transposase